MEIKITEQAVKWYEDELDIQAAAYIRLFPRFGSGGHIPGFSIGINHDIPIDLHTATEIDHITFFIESKDAWYFDGIDINITLNEDRQEPMFSF